MTMKTMKFAKEKVRAGCQTWHLASVFLFTDNTIVFEHQLRPEGIVAFVAILNIFFGIQFLRFRFLDDKPNKGLVFGIPVQVILLVIVVAFAVFLLRSTVFGRYLYAVGGNRKAAWLCGLPIRRVELAAYAISGALAGLAGVLLSILSIAIRIGDPTGPPPAPGAHKE